MMYLDLFLGFLRVGLFSFGGAYGAIPLIRDVVLSYGWLSDDMLTTMIAVSESTPGPIMVNMATYIGSSQAGIAGAALATLAVVLPAFVIILVIMMAMKTLLKHPVVQAVLRGMKPCVIGIVLATGLYMVIHNALPLSGDEGEGDPGWQMKVALGVVTVVMIVLIFASQPLSAYLAQVAGGIR